MKIISLSINNHDSSFTIIDNGKIIDHILSERFTKLKKSNLISPIFKEYIKWYDTFYDLLVIDVFDTTKKILTDQLHEVTTFATKCEKIKKFKINFFNHHIYHAYVGFYTSPFDEALCFVFDSGGCFIKKNHTAEVESIFLFKNKKFNKTLYKKYSTSIKDFNSPIYSKNIKNKNIILETSIGGEYENLSTKFGFSWDSAGKVMGLGQYKGNEEKLQYPYDSQKWKERVEESYRLQNYLQNKTCKLIKYYSEKFNISNIILTGGVSLNCVSNFNCIKNFPNLNLHVDPICSDKGASLGSCLFAYVQNTKQFPERITSTYLGSSEGKIDYTNYKHEKVKYIDIVKLLISGNIVAIFQGNSEIGERSLGNRSLLFDPRTKNGNNIVNNIKKRENFRPFAASILLEHVNEWFDIKTLSESKYMSFAVDAYEKTTTLVPAVIHANNTCRIQTVTEEQNYYFYNLIKTFYTETNVPMLLNTSFNLAGKPIVETFDDAILTLQNSQIEYLYIPHDEMLVTCKNLNYY